MDRFGLNGAQALHTALLAPSSDVDDPGELNR